MDEPRGRDDAQAAVIAFLADPATHGLTGPVGRVVTHANTILLAGPRAYKVKRPVRYPFLDYSTLARREAACRHEIEVNRRAAPKLYRGVVAVTRGADGRLALGGAGEPVEWAVEMTRFDETRTLDRLLAAGPPDDALVADLARMIAAAQAGAPVREAAPWIADLGAYVEQNDVALRAGPDLFAPAAVAAVTARARQWHARLVPLLEERGRHGLIRLLHGDLHSANVAMIDGAPVPFDAIEFDDAIATADILYDAGFLVMDLDERGHRAAACLLLNRYLSETVTAQARAGEGAEAVAARLVRHVEGLAALPFFLHMRAAIRAKVTASAAAALSGEAAEAARRSAQRYFAAAQTYLDPPPPVLIAVGGLSGSGKSTLARALAPRCGAAPGALHLRSDVVRKILAGVAETERLPAAGYTPAMSALVYRTLCEAARAGLAAGRSVVVDAVSARPEERAAFAAVAAGAEARFAGLWLDAPRGDLEARVGARRGDASDADAAVVAAQAGYDLGAMEWIRIDASGGPAETRAAALAALADAGFVPVSETE